MKTLLKIGDFLTSRNFSLGFYAFFTGFFGQCGFDYIHEGHIGWGLLFLAFALYDLANFLLWLTRRSVNVNIKIVKNKKESV
jgi:hypothetical protein